MGVFGRKGLSGANVVTVVRVGLLSMRSGLNRERHVGGGKWGLTKAGIALVNQGCVSTTAYIDT